MFLATTGVAVTSCVCDFDRKQSKKQYRCRENQNVCSKNHPERRAGDDFYHRSLLHERFRRIWTSFIFRIRSGDVSICRETAAVWAARLQLASAANNVSIGCLQKHQRNAINLAQVLLDFGYILYYIYINWGTYQQFAAMTFFCLSNEGFYLVNAAQLLLWLQTARVMIPGVCYQSLPCCLLIGGLTAACF